MQGPGIPKHASVYVHGDSMVYGVERAMCAWQQEGVTDRLLMGASL